MPFVFFKMIASIVPRLKYKINKILGDECYSSDKLSQLGFVVRKSLSDFSHSDYD